MRRYGWLAGGMLGLASMMPLPATAGVDKLAHATVSMGITGIAYATLPDDLPQRAAWAFGAGLGVGVAKEIWDSQSPGNRFSWSDIAADVLGAGIGAFVMDRWEVRYDPATGETHLARRWRW